jgi:hypothetical protein
MPSKTSHAAAIGLRVLLYAGALLLLALFAPGKEYVFIYQNF